MEFSLCPHTLRSTVRLADLSFTDSLLYINRREKRSEINSHNDDDETMTRIFRIFRTRLHFSLLLLSIQLHNMCRHWTRVTPSPKRLDGNDDDEVTSLLSRASFHTSNFFFCAVHPHVFVTRGKAKINENFSMSRTTHTKNVWIFHTVFFSFFSARKPMPISSYPTVSWIGISHIFKLSH